MKNKDNRPGDATERRERAEEIAREKAAQLPENLGALSPEETRRLFHELRVHQIELEMQNEELRRVQVDLDAARARYFDLYAQAPVGYCTLSEPGLILEANFTADELLGVAGGALVKQPIFRFIFKEDQDIYYRHRQQLFATAGPQVCELRMVKKDGTAFWGHLAATLGQDAHGTPVCRVVISDITERKRAEEQLQRSLEEKEVLLREVHHRVKNNLNIISSLLNLQASVIQTPEQALAAFRNSRDRVMAIALVHEELYKSQEHSRVDISNYLEKLTRQIQQVYDSGGDIRLSVQTEGIALSVNTAVPCGLILNELITNAFKHAFPKGGPGDIRILLRAVDHDRFELSISDNGIGLPEGYEVRETLGLTLVRLLTKQLDGTMNISTKNGTSYLIRFPK